MCAVLLTFVCMLRYSEWNVVPIWFLYSSVLMVVRCADLRSAIWFWDSSVLIVVRWADLVPVFFDIYGGTLGRSGPCILRYLWWYAEPGCCGGGVITTWAAGDGVIAAEPAV